MSNNISQALVREILVGGMKHKPKPKARAKPKPKAGGMKKKRENHQEGGNPLALAFAAPIAAAVGRAVVGAVDKATNAWEPTRRFRKMVGVGYMLPGGGPVMVGGPAKPRVSRPPAIRMTGSGKKQMHHTHHMGQPNSLYVHKAPLLAPY